MGKILGFTGKRLGDLSSPFPRLLAIEAKWDFRSSTRNAAKEEKIETHVEEDVSGHSVSKAIRELARWLKRVTRAQHKDEAGEMDQMFLYYHILKAAHHFENALKLFIVEASHRPSNDIFRRKVDKQAAHSISAMIVGVRAGVKYGAQDMAFIRGEINDSLEEKTGNLTDNWRLKAKSKKVGNAVDRLLRNRGFRTAVNIEVKDMRKVEHDANELEGIRVELVKQSKKRDSGKNSQKKYNDLLNRFTRVISVSPVTITELFRAAHIVLKNQLILMATILGDEKMILTLGPNWVQRHVMPRTTLKTAMSIKELEHHASISLHDVAIALNVHEKGMAGLSVAFERDLALAS